MSDHPPSPLAQLGILARVNTRVLLARLRGAFASSKLMGFTLVGFLIGYLVVGYIIFYQGLYHLERVPMFIQGNFFINKFTSRCNADLDSITEQVAKGDSSFVNQISYFIKTVRQRRVLAE